MALLEIEGLTVEFGTEAAPFLAVDGVDLTIDAGEIVGVVGESGSGKSVTALALMGLIDFPGRVKAKRMSFDGRDLLALSDRARRTLVGKDIAMIFQDPLASLNPVLHRRVPADGDAAHPRRRQRRRRAGRARSSCLQQVEIPDAATRLDAFPHQLSGGMAQRVMIAMAIACNPKLLIADEPTTALDVTVQAQILDLLRALQRERGMALLLITHDLAVVAETAQRVVVMYAGQQVETGPVPQIFETPRHPYTQALLAALPEHNVGRARLTGDSRRGARAARPAARAACLSPRCRYAIDRCRVEQPPLAGPPRPPRALPLSARRRGRPLATEGWPRRPHEPSRPQEGTLAQVTPHAQSRHRCSRRAR